MAQTLYVGTPSSGKVQIFFNRGQSPKQGAIEKFSKKLRAIVAEKWPDKDVRLVKEEATVAIGWTPLVKVVAPSRDGIALKWLPAVLATLGVAAEQKKKIADSFAAARGSVPDDQ